MLHSCAYNTFNSGDAAAFDHDLGALPVTLKTLYIRKSWQRRHPLRNAPPGLAIEHYEEDELTSDSDLDLSSDSDSY
jgi:hypothetical protein